MGRLRRVIEDRNARSQLGAASYPTAADWAWPLITASSAYRRRGRSCGQRQGELTIPSVDIAFDCGPQVNPDLVRSQLEGAVVMGVSLATLGEITFKKGRVEQDNFHQYQVTRIDAAPRRSTCIWCRRRLVGAAGRRGRAGSSADRTGAVQRVFGRHRQAHPAAADSGSADERLIRGASKQPGDAGYARFSVATCARERLHQGWLAKQADAYLIPSTEVRSFRLKEFFVGDLGVLGVVEPRQRGLREEALKFVRAYQ